ncbi:MAG: GGDEF domain-containing protein [Oscillospiraceae bacterium]
MSVHGRKSSILAVLFAIIFVTLSVLYACYITQLLTSESQMHLSEVATQSAASVQRQIARDFDMLEILADGIISKPEISLAEKMKRIKKQAEKSQIYRIALANLEGLATTSDGHEFSVADRDFFKAAVQGRRFLSEPIIDKADGVTPGIVYAVPIFHENQVVGVLFSGYQLDQLTKRIDISFYHESGLAFIVDSDSNVLLHPIKERIGTNIIDIATIYNKAEQVKQFQENLKRGANGVTHFVMRVEDRFFAYAPIQGGNDWFLFTSLPAKSVFERSQKVILFTILLLVGILLLLTLTALYIAMTRKKANAQILKLAFYDPLTGAANIQGFQRDAEALFRQVGAQKYTLLNFDVQQFRYLNNDLGYGAGNQFLMHITHCLTDVVGKGEIFARAGTDQFLFLFLNKPSVDETRQMIAHLNEQIAVWEQPSGGSYPVQIAFGVYQIEDRDTDIMLAIEKSNIARKMAKGRYESDLAIYDADMQNRIDRDTEMEKAMPDALKNGEFKLFIQPKYNLVSETIVGGEALVRWIKSDGTIIQPGEFIALFEQTGAIYRMDMYMFEQLCSFLCSQMERGLRTVPISINQSRRYMYSPQYVEVICEKLWKSGVPTRMIELEITENLVYTDFDKLVKVMDVLHREGFHISLDDFGSGYSSLNVLKDLQVDTLKLDRFMLSKTLHSEREKAIVANIIRMAQELKMSVVAEGIETREQVLFLRACGCETAQGYYYSKPVTAQRFEEMLCEEVPC